MTDSKPTNDNAPDTKICGTCGGPLPIDAVGASCPPCMLAAGFPTDGGSGAAAAAQALTPQDVASRFPDYEILGVLGRGGMGVVFKARHKALARDVALKVLPPAVAATAGFAERFQREARTLARLSHPNIVSVYEFGEREGVFFLVMEHVDGVNVRQAMRDGRLEALEALRIVPQICDALQYAHEHGVVHRDIKPENVLISVGGKVKVADFGLAKIVGQFADPADLTVSRQVMGTPHYMAPEQIERPAEVDHRADIYSLGVVFYEMLTGELPLGRFDPPSHRAQIDVRLDEVVLRSLAHAPERRWQQVSQVKTEVGAIAAGPAGPPVKPGPPLPPPGAAAEARPVTPVSLQPVSLQPVIAGALVVTAAIMAAVASMGRSGASQSAVLGVAALLSGGCVLRLWFSRSLRGAFQRRADGSRISRLAASALALAILSLFMCMTTALDPRSTWREGMLALLFGVGAFSMGLVAWVRIARSKGTLTGLWMAICASVVFTCAGCGAVPLSYMLWSSATYNRHVPEVVRPMTPTAPQAPEAPDPPLPTNGDDGR